MKTDPARKQKLGLRRMVALLALVLCTLQATLMLLSWLIVAAWPEAPIHSLLSSEGLRWLFGKLPQEISASGLTTLLLLTMAAGALRFSGLAKALKSTSHSGYQDRVALRFVAAELLLMVVLLMLLTLPRHAVLLSIGGKLMGSPFTSGLLPALSLALLLLSLTFGLVSGRLRTAAECLQTAYVGIQWLAPLLLLWILGATLICSLRFALVI